MLPTGPVDRLRSIEDRGDILVATTADAAGVLEHVPLSDFLRRIREAFGVDVVFVSQFRDGRRVIRSIDSAPSDDECLIEAHASSPLKESYCFHVVEGRLPQIIYDTAEIPLALSISDTANIKIGSHLSVPIIGVDGYGVGTVCCFTHHPDHSIGSQVQLETLRTVADLLAQTFVQDLRPKS